MRFAPPNPLRIADRASGLNAISVRSYNERLVLSLLLQNDATTRLEIGEKTGLSAQTISVIVRSLEQEGLVVRGQAQRGRVGPPTTPLMLNPEGAFSVGVSVGHRNAHIVLVDFVGNVKFARSVPHRTPGEFDDVDGVTREVAAAVASLSRHERTRIAGIGVGIPAPNEGRMASNEELHKRLEIDLGLPVFVQNDIAAAAAGESLFGPARTLQDFLYFYLGARLHSRLILNHQIYNGNSPVSHDVGVSALERSLVSKEAAELVWNSSADWTNLGQIGTEWFDECVNKLVGSITALSQFIEVQTIVLASFVPLSVTARLCSEVESKLPFIQALPGKTGVAPKAIGAASLPFSSRFMLE
ncbi:ROK family transcriptional regulator [Ochrobactrum sp. RH2CCR150]|uniref:ROK family transcriptional regulator n=1 Tax=Ochrobactrum sp. RH2CCR150 TaxID=2587044 RepID=UPI0015FCA883